MSVALRVLNGGVLTTVQDAGRQNALHYGVPRSGAMDLFALQAANRLVGNPPDAACLEITFGGAAFEVLRPTLLAIAGADLAAVWNDTPLALWRAVFARRGDHIVLPGRAGEWGARAYLALGGGVDVPLVLGSRSTNLTSGFGGLGGRALRQGDTIGTYGEGIDTYLLAGRRWPAAMLPAYKAAPTLRFIPGPHHECFESDAPALLAATPLSVSQHSNRMGYRLEGVTLQHKRACNLPSLGVIPGVIQVPPDGTPILLMADAQTTGGYPIVGVVIAPDLPLAAQLLPGDSFRLVPTTQEDAVVARQIYAAWCSAELHTDDTIFQTRLAGALG